jgi:diguanylate cyclase (GGDEF)-like protein
MREEGAKGELKHHVTRIAILLAGYCLARFASHGYESSSPMIGFGLAGFVLLMVGIRIYGCFNSSLSEPLNWVNVMLDPLVAAALIISAGDSGVALVFVFSWMPISDGFRRGERWLVVSALFSSIGLLCVLLSASYFDDAGLLLCGIFAGHVLVISYIGEVLRSYRRTQEKLSAMSMRDTLTQLPNRRLFLEHLRHLMLTSRRSKNRIACLFIDLDGFKAVNDRLGHSVGDKVLLRVAEVLKRHLRQGDIAARLSGDEFMYALECSEAHGEVGALASSILREIEAIRRIDDHAITLSASIGIAFYQGDPNERNPDADKLIGEADHYMYDAKRAGKGQIVAPALNVVR